MLDFEYYLSMILKKILKLVGQITPALAPSTGILDSYILIFLN